MELAIVNMQEEARRPEVSRIRKPKQAMNHWRGVKRPDLIQALAHSRTLVGGRTIEES